MVRKSKRSVQPIIDSIERELLFIPRMSSYGSVVTSRRKSYVRRRAKFAPDLLAEGLSTGIVSSSNTLLHGYFDDDDSKTVDRHVNIQSDKFVNLMKDSFAPSVDPSSAPDSTSNPSE